MSISSVSDEELHTLRENLSKPDEVRKQEGWTHCRFHVATDGDLEVVKKIVLQRLEDHKQEAASA